MIDLAPEYLEKVRTILHQHVPQCEVRAFGSRVSWTAKDYSDLDLAVVCSHKLSDDTLRHLKEAFAESDLPVRVDVLDWHATSPEFQKVIEKQYEVVQVATNSGRSVAPGLSPAHAALKDGATSLGMAGDAEPIYGSLPNSWRIASVAQLVEEGTADVQTGPFGTMLHASAYQTEGTPVVAVKNIGDNRLIHDGIPRVDDVTRRSLSRYQLQRGDILFGRKGAVERRAYVRADENGWLQGSDCIRLRLQGAKVDSRFLSFVLGSEAYRSWITQHAHGATMPSLNQEIVGRIPLPLPPPNEQRAIAHILGTLDDKIELNRRMNETLEAMARALFKSWFVDFDPVRAKAKGRNPGLPKRLSDLFPDSLQDSELGEIPKGWQIRPFAETVEIFGGGTPKTAMSEYWNGDIPWFSVVDAPRDADVWVVDSEKKITQAGVESSSTRVLPEGTTIITARGTVGRIALVGVPMAMNQSCYGLRGKINANGSFTYFMTRKIVAALQQGAHGSVFDTITRDSLIAVSVGEPPDELIEIFEGKVGPILERIRTSLLASRTLAALRDTLLPKLISGEIRIRDLGTNLKECRG